MIYQIHKEDLFPKMDSIHIIQQAIDVTNNEIHSTYITKVSQHTRIHHVIQKFIGLYSYKLQILRELKKSDYVYRLKFCSQLRKNVTRLNNILWLDEIYHFLDEDISHYHFRIRTMTKKKHCLKKLLHPQKFCVWFGSMLYLCYNYFSLIHNKLK